LVSGSLPLIVSFCGSDLLGSPVSGVLWRIREACSRAIGFWAARRASAIIVKSQNLFHALPTDLQDRAEVLPNGVDVNTFLPMDRDECRARLGWDKKSKIILFDACWNGERQGRNRKNPALARATVDLLAKSIPDLHLFMMSNVPHKEIPLMMNAADCLLVTSLQEGSANLIKEAMACNLPVISVPCGDVVERLSRTSPGGIRPYNAAALAQCVHAVISTGRRSNGREQLTLQNLTTVQVAERLMQIYQQVQAYSSARKTKVAHRCEA
jgi:glycosyltransferase involved in cell wall biosynthesis